MTVTAIYVKTVDSFKQVLVPKKMKKGKSVIDLNYLNQKEIRRLMMLAVKIIGIIWLCSIAFVLGVAWGSERGDDSDDQ